MSNGISDEEAFKLGFDRTTFGVNRKELEAKGEGVVRSDLNSGSYGNPGHKTYTYVSAWLAEKEFACAEDKAEVQRAASASARETARWTKWAVLVAAAAAVLAANDQILALIRSYY